MLRKIHLKIYVIWDFQLLIECQWINTNRGDFSYLNDLMKISPDHDEEMKSLIKIYLFQYGY